MNRRAATRLVPLMLAAIFAAAACAPPAPAAPPVIQMGTLNVGVIGWSPALSAHQSAEWTIPMTKCTYAFFKARAVPADAVAPFTLHLLLPDGSETRVATGLGHDDDASITQFLVPLTGTYVLRLNNGAEAALAANEFTVNWTGSIGPGPCTP